MNGEEKERRPPPPPPLLFETMRIEVTPATPMSEKQEIVDTMKTTMSPKVVETPAISSPSSSSSSSSSSRRAACRPSSPLPPMQRTSYVAAVSTEDEPEYARVQIRSQSTVATATSTSVVSPISVVGRVLEESKAPLVVEEVVEVLERTKDTMDTTDTKETTATKKSLMRLKRNTRNEEARRISRERNRDANDALQSLVSALYCKLLVILGLAFPMAEVVVDQVPTGYYQLFYVYLFLVSLIFLLYLYLIHLWSNKANVRVINDHQESGSNEELENYSGMKGTRQQYGSFYLRMGAVLFGGGGMIYNGIEIGSYLEMNLDASCENLFTLVKPALQMIFVFAQMYFIFIFQNSGCDRMPFVSRLGLMHMLATNLCVWLNVLIVETGHEIRHQQHKHQQDFDAIAIQDSDLHHLGNDGQESFRLEGSHAEALTMLNASRGCPSTSFLSSSSSSSWVENQLMTTLMHDSAPFLFPCIIEYSLICAAVLFVMWKHVGNGGSSSSNSHSTLNPKNEFTLITHSEHYTVDCSQSHTGLFVGILVLVLTIISLIVFFVLINSKSPHLRSLAIAIASLSELALYTVATLAVLMGMCELRKLYYEASGQKLELDQLLLVVAQTGVFVYAAFCLIGSFFQLEDHAMAFLASLATMIQTCLQTIFILDASRRFVFTPTQVNRKPGREVVTFLLVCNLAMWAINTLETNRADSHPIQLRFYGAEWAWPVITHISMPLAIFYRFHSTVCLCEIWKNTYKYRPHRMAKV